MRHPLPRNSGELLQDWSPAKPLPDAQRCKAAVADALAGGPREKRRLDHLMLCDGWAGEQIEATKRALGVVETGVMLPRRGIVVLCSLPGGKTPTAYRGVVAPPAFEGESNGRREAVPSHIRAPHRLGAPKR